MIIEVYLLSTNLIPSQ